MFTNKIIKITGLVMAAMFVMLNQGWAREMSKSGFDIENTYDVLEAEVLSIVPSVPEYTIEPGLANVVNLDVFDGELNPEQIDMIAANGFVVTPSENKQIFWIYEQNDYFIPKIPSFITSDSMLHTYHFFFDYLLRTVETNNLIPALSSLNKAMVAASEEDMNSASDPDIVEAARKNLAYFAVADYLLDGTDPSEGVQDDVRAEIDKIEAHQSRDASTIFYPVLIDYTQFIPRGHYTRTEELGKYFKAMMWYGLVPMPIDDSEDGLDFARQVLQIVRNLREASYEGTPALEFWETIYEPTTFFIGESDNVTFYDLSIIMDDVFGRSASPDEFSDESSLLEFIAEVKSLPGQGIEQFTPFTDEGGEWYWNSDVQQFKFMGQRFIPDSRIFQELVIPKVDMRYTPVGLDLFAAMGSERSLDILGDFYYVHDYAGYDTQMDKMRDEMDETSLDTWQSNLYYGWLWGLKSIIEPVGEGYPSFMRNDAWLDKSLFTSLGSWTELRHDTVLYARQSVAECGSDDEEPPPPKSYVEPNLEFWTRMQWLVDYTYNGLESRGLTDRTLEYQFERLGDLVAFCRGIAMKELADEEATVDEYYRMSYYGGSLESLMLSCAGGDILSEADKDMALVVDVHNSFGAVLQEATGRAAIIYVVVPINGELYLTRGGVYTQYEFDHPASDRLTDEEWREMLENGEVPPFAEWTDSFMETGDEIPERPHLSGGC